MTPAQDPFYIVKDEIQDSIEKVQDTFHQWKQMPENTGEKASILDLFHYIFATPQAITTTHVMLSRRRVDELEKAISVAERNPAYYGLNESEIGRRRSWTNTARNQEKLLGELSLDMETTSNRLDFVQFNILKLIFFVCTQKRVAMVMKKASWKGQIMMIAFLVILFIILFVLVFLT
ncbi:hypothetical protein BAE44_0015201 [Dichanthelium oligosanthes]|uniref:Syntaxin 6/10/61 N-terminal domain-containing protein n=1 Tax=Dichanthelium oligosanthes TaxID=888268 RepID=A0A1E5VF62_9POAL|nr:hypothetical protein BAE44_0015201 [Dichanthelium oligosanthes]